MDGPSNLDDELNAMLNGLDAELDAALGPSRAPRPGVPRTPPPLPVPAPPAPARPAVATTVPAGSGDAFAKAWRSPRTVDDGQGLSVVCVDTINAVFDHLSAVTDLNCCTVPRVAFRNTRASAIENARVRISGGRSPLIGEWSQTLGRLRPGQTWARENVRLPLFNAAIRGLVEEVADAVTVEVLDDARVLAARTIDVRVQPYAHWPFVREHLWTLTAFVWPNQAAVQDLIRRAADLQRRMCGTADFEGYQCYAAGKPQRVAQQLASLYDVLGPAGVGLHYINPPASFNAVDGAFGQKIRFPSEVVAHGRGTCLDLAVLLASLMEQVNLNPLLVLVPGHAFAGCWVAPDQTFKDKAVDLLRTPDALTLVKDGRIALFNSVNMTWGKDFGEALAYGMHWANEAAEKAARGAVGTTDYFVLIDVAACRRHGVTPLPPL